MKEKKSKFLKYIKAKSLSVPALVQPDPLEMNFSKQAQSLFKKAFGHTYQQYQQHKNVIDKRALAEFVVLNNIKKQIFTIFHEEKQLIGFVDQHAIHERIRYEYFVKNIQGKSTNQFDYGIIEKNNKRLESVLGRRIPKLLYICKRDQFYLQKEGNQIQKWGFKMKIRENSIYLVEYQEVFEKCLSDDILTLICSQILFYQKEKLNRIPGPLDRLIAERSCKSAVKFNDDVSLQWCKRALHSASCCDFPWHCVHGRPTVHFVSSSIPYLPSQYRLD